MNARIWGIIGGFALVLALLSPYVLGSSKKVEQLFEAAEMLYENSDYEAAIAKYEEALKESNKLLVKTEAIDKDFTTFVNLKIAMSYAKLAEQSEDANYYHEKALKHIDQAVSTVKLAKHQEELTYLWGQILYKTGELEEASEKFTELIENFPNSRFVEKAQETMAQINKQLQGSEEEGTEDVVAVTDLIPLWINDLSKFEAFNKKKNTLLIIPNRLRSEKQYVKAAEQYEAFANTNPSIIEAAYALYWSGWCYYKVSSDDTMLLDKSCVAFQRLVDNHSDSPYTHKAREKLSEIWNLKLKHESKKAIIAAEEAVDRAQQSDCQSNAIRKAITHLGNAKREQERGNYAAARTSANEAQTIVHSAIDNHETAKRYVNQGYIYLNQGRLETATKKAKEAHHTDSSCQPAKKLLEEIKQEHLNRGINYIEAEEYAKAIPPLKKAIDIAPCKEAFYNLGVAYLQSGEFENAKAACKAALTIDPTYKDARDLCDSIED